MSGTYAERTTVSTQASRADIERTLEKYGATAFVSGWDQRQHVATVMFDIAHRRIRFVLPLPDPTSPEFTRTATGRSRSAAAQREEFERAQRQRWRALLLVIKAKLEAVEAGITTVDDEFLAHILVPGTDQTVGGSVGPDVARAYEVRGHRPLLALPGADAPDHT